MRLITRTIHRAFPELDRFSDEQCIRFVRAARGGFIRRTIRDAAVGLLGFVLTGVSLGLFIGIAQSRYVQFDPLSRRYNPWTTVLACILVVAAFVPGPIAAFAIRDYLLRRRVRFVLRTRGVCQQCWYSLVGLVVGPASSVTCPECGHESPVDASLGELTVDAAGQRVFQTEAGILELRPRFWTPRRSRMASRITLWTLGAVLGAALLSAGAWEYHIRSQARAAAAARVLAAGLLRFVQEHQPALPPGASGEADGWDALQHAIQLVEGVDNATWKRANLVATTGEQIKPMFELVHGGKLRWGSGQVERNPELKNACKALALQALDAYAAAGLGQALDRVSACGRMVRPIDLAENEPLFNMLAPGINATRDLVHISAAELARSHERGDHQGSLRALEAGLALARLQRQQPLVVDGLTAMAMERLMLERLAACLVTCPSADWLDAADAVLRRQACPLPRSYHLEGQRLVSHDTIAWAFGKPNRVRFGRFSPGIQDFAGGDLRTPLGSFRSNIREYDALTDQAIRQLNTMRTQRPVGALGSGPTLLTRMLTPSPSRFIKSVDEIEQYRSAVGVMFALERFRAGPGHGAYPASLSELVPGLLESVPIDHAVGRPLSYKRLDSPDSRGRRYSLYIVGPNGIDDDGLEAPQQKSPRVYVPNSPPEPDDIILNPAPNREPGAPPGGT